MIESSVSPSSHSSTRNGTNAPFGAVARWSEIVDADAANEFFARGLAYLAGA